MRFEVISASNASQEMLKSDFNNRTQNDMRAHALDLSQVAFITAEPPREGGRNHLNIFSDASDEILGIDNLLSTTGKLAAGCRNTDLNVYTTDGMVRYGGANTLASAYRRYADEQDALAEIVQIMKIAARPA